MLQVINNSALEVCREDFYAAEIYFYVQFRKDFWQLYIYIYINKVDYEKPLI